MEFFKFTDIAEEFFLWFGGDIYKDFMWVYFLIGGICFITVYAFQAVGLFVIAGREGFKNRWMAFVPFLNTYYIGVVSEKNRIFNFKAKQVALAAAILEFVYAALTVLYYVAQYLIFSGNFATPEYQLVTVGGVESNAFTGIYTLEALPRGLEWAGWVFTYFPTAFLSWMSLLFLAVNIFLLIAFFQTYSCRHYVLFALLSVFFPIKGIFMFAVKNNTGKNYGQYLKEKQQMQYQAYQEYMRRNGGYNNYNNPNNPYNGGSFYGSAPQDPFDGMGGNNRNDDNGQNNSGSNGGDPFEDF